MVSFIHIADKNDERSIIRNGIRAARRLAGPRGVCAVPVVPDFSTTHQWARELRRRGSRALICVQFKVPSKEKVFVGRYNSDKSEMTASDAAAAFLEHTDPMGLEAIIPRRILPREIARTYLAPRIAGWRYYPEAKGRQPFCRCSLCNRGEIRAQRLIRGDR